MVKKVRCKIGQMIDEHMATDKVVYPSPLHEVAKAFYSSGVDIDEGFGAISVLSKLGYLDCEVVKEEPGVININCALGEKRSKEITKNVDEALVEAGQKLSSETPRYWVFAYDSCYPMGGMYDRIATFDDRGKAIRRVDNATDEKFGFAEVWDVVRDERVYATWRVDEEQENKAFAAENENLSNDQLHEVFSAVAAEVNSRAQEKRLYTEEE